MLDEGVVTKVFFQEKSMKILRTIVLVGLVASWGQAGCALEKNISYLKRSAESFHQSKQPKQQKQTSGPNALPKQEPTTTKEVTPIPQQPTPKFNMSDLLEAAKHGNAELVQAQLEVNEKANIEMPLAYAAQCGYIGILKILIPYATQEQRINALCTAAQYNQLDAIETLMPVITREKKKELNLLQKGLKLLRHETEAEPKPLTPLMEVCRYQHKPALALLLYGTEKFTIDDQDTTGMTALMWAFRPAYTNIHPDIVANIVKQLLDANAQVNIQDNNGWTALMYAVEKNISPVVKMILDAPGVDINLKSSDDRRALDIAYFVRSKKGENDPDSNSIIAALEERGAKAKVKMLPVKRI